MTEKIKNFLKWWPKWGLSTLGVAFVLIFGGTFIYYWVATPSAAVLVSADEFPNSLSLGFSPDALIDRIEAHIHDVVTAADSGGVSEVGAQTGWLPQPTSQKVIPETALSPVPHPYIQIQMAWGGFEFGSRMGYEPESQKAGRTSNDRSPRRWVEDSGYSEGTPAVLTSIRRECPPLGGKVSRARVVRSGSSRADSGDCRLSSPPTLLHHSEYRTR
jgi:hypothetical protein